jgi:hypothetical protein
MPKDFFKPGTVRKLFPEQRPLSAEQQHNLERHEARRWALLAPKTERLVFTESDDTVTVVKQCPFCKVSRELVINRERYRAWRGGRLVQDVFPDLSRAERELLITGIDDACWQAQFRPE